MATPPPVRRVIETCVYCDDLDAAEAFYSGLLGLRKIWRSQNRDLFYAVGDSVLLIFNPNETRKGGSIPPHGADGSSHFALSIDPDQYDPWLAYLRAAGVAIENEHAWPDWGARSIYFHDPSGNLVELITRPAWEKSIQS
jgi:catechol 2,3-dioxygenase-like lactoylglutathione lyase family enzyme